jgi:hypothetical protein
MRNPKQSRPLTRLRIPHAAFRTRVRWWGWLAMAATVILLYLVALSAVPALLREDAPPVDTARPRRTIAAENWSLVVPDERAELAAAIDAAWRSLRAYQAAYRAGTPAQLAASMPVVVADSAFNLDRRGRIISQRDTNFSSAAAPGSGGRDERFEGYRVRTTQPYVNERNRRIGDAELIYQRSGTVWTCQRTLADKEPPPPPGLRLAEGGDAGFAEIDGFRVRGFTLPAGAFGLRSPATVWVDVASLLVRRQEIDSLVRGQREVWTYGGFDEVTEITPPSGVSCSDG